MVKTSFSYYPFKTFTRTNRFAHVLFGFFDVLRIQFALGLLRMIFSSQLLTVQCFLVLLMKPKFIGSIHH